MYNEVEIGCSKAILNVFKLHIFEPKPLDSNSTAWIIQAMKEKVNADLGGRMPIEPQKSRL